MNVAVLIDAENIEPVHAEQIFSYASSVGTVVVREIFGAGIALNEWFEPILKYAIHMNMTLKPNRYKNSSDIALVIRAMELLAEHGFASAAPLLPAEDAPDGDTDSPAASEGVGTIVIASSDSDFSALSVRLRTAGIDVVGMGNQEKTNPSWPLSCTAFIPLTTSEPAAARPVRNINRTPPPQQEQRIPAQTPETRTLPQPAQEPRAAFTHYARAENIRNFITAQLAENGGKMQVLALLEQLGKLPDYRYDQQHSNKRPLDYLMRQYNRSFRFERDSDGIFWISPNTAPERALPAPQEPAESAAPAAPEEPEETETQNQDREPPEDVVAAYIAAGVPEEAARQLAGIRAEDAKNMRAVYNRLRKVFGNDEGRKYYQIMKRRVTNAE